LHNEKGNKKEKFGLINFLNYKFSLYQLAITLLINGLGYVVSSRILQRMNHTIIVPELLTCLYYHSRLR